MATLNVSDARTKLAAALTQVTKEPVFLERYGKPTAVIVSAEFYERAMEALEDAEDIAAIEASLAEDAPNIPWAQVRADLGWA